ncbi:class III lanthipeptide [Bacillus pacificus]
MKKLLSLQHTALDKEVVLLAGKSSVSLGCDNISTVSLYFCGKLNIFSNCLILILKEIKIT